MRVKQPDIGNNHKRNDDVEEYSYYSDENPESEDIPPPPVDNDSSTSRLIFHNPECMVWVGNLSKHVTKNDIAGVVQGCGDVKKI